MDDRASPLQVPFVPILVLVHIQVALLFLARLPEGHVVERRVGLAIVFAVTLAGLATWQLIATIRLHRDASPLPLATARLAFLVVACVAWIVTARQI